MKRPRFLGVNLPQWLLVAALVIVLIWLAGAAMLLIEIMQVITGAGTKGCS